MITTASLLIAATVVIDPGHGGHQSGATGRGGVQEKTVVLLVARHVRDALVRTGVHVVLTRDGDEHVPLKQRSTLANRRDADIFVSIHANSSPAHGRRGSETYILSAHKSDDVALALVNLENEGRGSRDFVDEDAFGGGRGPVSSIVADLKRSVAHQRSARLAKSIQDALGEVPALGPSRGLRQAPFHVLASAQMPSVLVELGYLSHDRQAAQLNTPAVQARAGAAIAHGILDFLRQSL